MSNLAVANQEPRGRMRIALLVLLLGLAIGVPLHTAGTPNANPAGDPAPTEQPPGPGEPTAGGEEAEPGDAESSPMPTPAPEVEPTMPPADTPEPSATSPPATEPAPTPAPTPEPAETPAGDSPSPEPLAASPYLVTFRSAAAYAGRASVLERLGVVETGGLAALRVATVQVPWRDEAALVAALRGDPTVLSVERDGARAIEAGPSDPRYAEQWALERIGWPIAWSGAAPTGQSIVAVLDTGVDASHPDLRGQLLAGRSFVDGADPATDQHGHGTQMAGIVAALTDNELGVAGVAFSGVRVLPVTVLGSDGRGWDSAIIEGLVWAVDNGADVVLMAFSGTRPSTALQAAIDYAWAHGVLPVAAVGNDGASQTTYPAGDAGVVGVAATDFDDRPWPASNRGSMVFLAAPGRDIVTTTAGGGYVSVTGTSAAAAQVAAAAALLRAREPRLANGVIASRLARTASPSGERAETGNGRLDLARAWADDLTDSVKPAGASPGGPYVGPYRPPADDGAPDAPPSYTIAAGPAFRSSTQNAIGSGATSLTVSRPSGVVAGDALIAAIAVRPSTATVSTPTGWTLLRRTDQTTGTTNSQLFFWKIATSSEPSSYTWTIGNAPTGAAGGVVAFTNLSTCALVDVHNGQATAGSLSHAAPSVTTTQSGDMLLTAHSFASAATWSPPSGMTEAVDVASEVVPNAAGVAMSVNYQLLGAAGSTGTRTATASGDSDVGVGQTVALRNSCTRTWDGGAGTSNWGDANNWNPNGVPTASDHVSLTGANTINVNVAGATNDMTLNNASLLLTINTSQSLNVTGDFTFGAGTLNTNASFPSISGAVSIAAGTTTGFTASSGSQTVAARNYGNLVISGGGTKTLAGSVTLGGNLSVNGGIFDLGSNTANRGSAGGTLTVANGATLRIGGTGTLPSNYSSHSIGSSSTIQYGGTTTTVAALNSSQSYGNLLITGSGVTTAASFTVVGSLTVNSGGSLVASAGTLTMSGTAWSMSNSGTLTLRGLTIAGTPSTQPSASFNVAATLTVNASQTFAPGGGTVTFTGTAWLISNSGTLAFNGLTVAGTPTTQPSASFAVSGALTVNSSQTFSPSGTVTLNDGASIANSGTLTFVNLSIASSATVSGSGNFAVNTGSFTINGGASYTPAATQLISGTGTLTGSGTARVTRTASTAGFTNQYTISNRTLTNLTVEYSGTAAQVVSALTYGHLAMNNSSGATLAGNVTVNGTLTLTSGNLATAANTLIIGSGGTVSRTSGHIVGNLRKTVVTGSPTVSFEVGDAGAYAPVTVTFSNVTVAGTLTASTTGGDHPSISSSTINVESSANRYWTLANASTTFSSYSATFNFVAGDLDGGANPSDFKVGRFASSTWSYPTVGTRTSTSTQATGLTGFGDFQVGADVSTGAFRSVASGNWNSTSTWQRFNGSSWVTPAATPTSADGIVTIRTGHTVTVTASVTVDQVVVEASAQLTLNSAVTLTLADGAGTDLNVSGTFQSAGTLTVNAGATITFQEGSRYQHNQNGGTIPTATWAATSTMEVIGWTSQTTAPGGISQAYGNFTWNSTGQTASVSLAGNFSTANGGSVAGTMSIASTGTGSLRLLNSGSTAALTVGSFSQSGGTFAVRGTGTTSTTSFTLTVTGDFSLSGGEFRLTEATSSATNVGALDVGGNMSLTGGTLTRTGSTGSATVTFNGSAAQAYSRTSATISGAVDFVIASNASVSFGTSTITGSSGTFAINTGATLATGHASGITSSGASGTIQVTGSRSYSTGASYTYNGSSAQATGNGLPSTVANLTVANSAGVTLTASVSVTGSLGLTSGVLATGANNVYVTSTGTVSRTTGRVNGQLRKHVATGATSRAFEVGDATSYAPITVSFASVTVAGDLTASTTGGDHPNLSSSVIDQARSANRYWTLSASGVTFTTYSATFSFVAGDVDAGATAGNFVVGRYSGGAWSLPTLGTRTATSIQATGLSAFGDFAAGEARVATRLSIAAVNGGVAPEVGQPFDVVIEAQDAAGSPAMVGFDVDVALLKTVGTGSFGGTTSGTIPTGASSLTLSVTYEIAENGVQAYASATNTDELADSATVTFNVTPNSNWSMVPLAATVRQNKSVSIQLVATAINSSARTCWAVYTSGLSSLSAQVNVQPMAGATWATEVSGSTVYVFRNSTNTSHSMASGQSITFTISGTSGSPAAPVLWPAINNWFGSSTSALRTTLCNLSLSSYAPRFSYTVNENQPPTTPDLVAPDEDEVVGTGKPTFSWAAASDPDGDSVTYRIEVDEQEDFSSPLIAVGGIGATSFTPTTPLSAGTYVWRVRAEDDLDTGEWSAAQTFDVDLGLFTQHADIGGPSLAGTSSHSSGTYTISASGNDIWNAADQFQFIWREFTGDGRITARVVSIGNTDPFAKAGVMMRETAAAGSKNAAVLLTPNNTNGIRWQQRFTTDATTSRPADGFVAASPPVWLRLTRAGSVFTAEYSSNGTSWTQLSSSQTINMSNTILVGLAVTSHTNSALTTAVIDNVSVVGTPLATGDSYQAVENVQLVVDAPGVLANDSDPGNQPLSAALVSTTSQGTLTLDADGSFTYTPGTDFVGADSFTYRASNGALQSATVTVTIDVQYANRAPVNSVPGAQVVGRNSSLPFSTANGNAIAISDVDAGTNPLQLTLSATNGTLTLRQTSGLTFSAGSGTNDATMTFSGTLSAINAAIDGLRFAPTAGYTGNAGLSMTTNDQGWTGAGGAKTANSNVAVTVTDFSLFDASADVGPVFLNGTASNSGSTYTLKGAGADIWNTADEFHYAYRAWTGDGTITARVISVGNTDPWAKAGVMFRDSLDAGSRHAMVVVTPSNGVAFQWRATTGGTSGNANQTGIAAPYWVRLVRSGDTFTGYRSSDGENWTQQGASQTISMGQTIYVGLALTSHNTQALSTATFDGISIHSLLAPSGLTATAISTRRVDLAWTANDANATGYEIEASTNGSDYSPAGSASGAATGHSVSGLSPATAYWFRIRAVSGSGASDWVYTSATTLSAPLATDDTYQVIQDGVLHVTAPGLRANDPDGTNAAFAASKVSDPAHGSLTVYPDGSFTYTPQSGFTGSDSFTYRLSDGALQGAPATVSLSVLTTAYVSDSGWSPSFSSSRYLSLAFPAYVPSGATVEGATFRHAYRSYAGGTTCWYLEVFSASTLIGTHGSASTPISCNSSASFVTDTVSLPEVDSVERANSLVVRIYVRNSAGGRSEHGLATAGIDYWLAAAP